MSDEGGRKDTLRVSVPPQAAGSRTVLVVDDEAEVARSLKRVLSHAGFEVTTVGDGAEAVDLIIAKNFDVIVSDIQMPKMSGVDLLRVVRSYDLDVPVILMTGDPKVETAIEAVSLGALQYLVKPTRNEDLTKSVERASRLHRMAKLKRDALTLQGREDNQAGDRAGLELSLDRALASMWVAFQPIVHAQTGEIFGYEALMRSEESTLPAPAAVLSAAERLGRLRQVGRRMRELAAEGFREAPSHAVLFVNLHTQDLLDPALYEDSPLAAVADRVVLEITERATIENVMDIQARTSILRYTGYRLAIDDLGAGYAGLSSFAALEPEIVKLDISLVRNVHLSVVRQKLVASMTALCKEMSAQLVGEGVEIEEERHMLRELGCDLLQGYLFAKPGRHLSRRVRP